MLEDDEIICFLNHKIKFLNIHNFISKYIKYKILTEHIE